MVSRSSSADDPTAAKATLIHSLSLGLRSTAGALAGGIDAALMVSALGIVYALIAYAAIGPQLLSFSILSTMIGAVVGGIATMLASGTRLRIVGPTASGVLVIASLVRDLQDLPSIRNDPGAAILAATATVFVAGVVQIFLARLRFGSLLKFVPYPVMMGFANSVALLLVVSVLPAALGHDYPGRIVDIARWFHDWQPASLVVAAIGAAGGLVITRWFPRAPTAFIALLVATFTYHALATVCPTCTLGPVLVVGSTADLVLPHGASLAVVLGQGVSFWILVVQSAVVLAILTSLFSLLSAAQVLQPRDPIIDGNRLMYSLGVGNVCAAFLLGMPIATSSSATRTIRRYRTRPWITITSYFLSVFLVFAIGRRWFGLIPLTAISSAVFVNAGNLFDKATWPWLRRAMSRSIAARTTRGPLAIAGLVIAVGLLKGLAAAMFAGSLAAACLLAIEMRRGVVIAVHDGRACRSRRVWSDVDTARLDAAGDQVRIIVLGHWLYFGTADALADVLESSKGARWLLLDLRKVSGIDLTAARSLARASERLDERGVRVIVTGLPEDDTRRDRIEAFRGEDGRLHLALVATLDEALEQVETDLLGALTEQAATRSIALPGIDDELAGRLAAWIEPVSLAAGATLFEGGEAGDALYSMRSGRLTLYLRRDDRTRHRLLTFGVNGVFGELALLDGRPRSADAIADTECTLWRLSRERLDTMALADHPLHAAVLNGIALHLSNRLRNVTRLLDLG